MNRRSFLRSFTALTVASTLVACNTVTSTTTNGVTEITVKVAQIVSYAQAAINFTQLILATVGVAVDPTIAALLRLASTTVATDLQAFVAASNGAVTMSFDATSVPTEISSLLADSQKILTLAQTALGDTINKTAATYIADFGVVVSVFEALLGFVSAPKSKAVGTPMISETEALAKLGVVR